MYVCMYVFFCNPLTSPLPPHTVGRGVRPEDPGSQIYLEIGYSSDSIFQADGISEHADPADPALPATIEEALY